MFQNGIKLSNSVLIWRKHGLKEPSRLYSSACLHCKAGGQPVKGLRLLLPRRDYSSNAERPKKSHPIRNTLVLLGATTGAVVAYAKFDPDFRKQVEEISPTFNEFIKLATQEERSYEDSYNIVSNYITSLYTDLLGDSSHEEPKKPSLPAPPKALPARTETKPTSQAKGSDVSSKSAVQSPPPPPPTAKPPAREKPAPTSSAAALGNVDDEIRLAATGALSAIRDATAAVKSKGHVQLLVSGPYFKARVGVSGQGFPAQRVQNKVNSNGGPKAREVKIQLLSSVINVQGYSEDIGKLLDNQVDNRDNALWSGIRAKTASKEKLVSEAERTVSEATETLSKVRAAVEFGDLSPSERDRVRRLLSAATSQVESARRELEEQKRRASVTDRYWSRVEDARRHFQEEIQALFPNAKISEKKLELPAEDLDLFLLHVFKHVIFYQRELARLESIGEQQVRQALDRSGDNVSDQLIQLRVKQAVEKERRRLEEELQRKLLLTRSDQEKELRSQLKRQLETAQDHLNDVLNAKETDLERRVARKLDERDNAERVAYETKIATMLSQLKALELVLGERIEADRNAHQAHVLFSACQSLFRALRSGVPGSHWSEQLRPLSPEISAVSNAVGGKDPLVATVLAAVPPEAQRRGVYPETALRERFLRVEQVARRVALVPESGGSLLRYLLSYIQSALIISSSAIPTKELRDEPVDVSKLDTYDLLQRARYWVDRGDLTMSLRYMNLLGGASRAVASQWMDEARIYLETQLIVNTLMAHAAATGMLYL